MRNLHQLFDWQYIGQMVEISQNFMAFSEYMNFNSFSSNFSNPNFPTPDIPMMMGLKCLFHIHSRFYDKKLGVQKSLLTQQSVSGTWTFNFVSALVSINEAKTEHISKVNFPEISSQRITIGFEAKRNIAILNHATF